MTTQLWSAEDAAAAIGGRAVGDWAGVSGVSIDTREIAAPEGGGFGDLFVALAGERRDGHAFVADALAKGAAAALVSKRPEDVAADAPLLIAPGDTLSALEALARAARARSAAAALAVTGSVGKTSTKDMIAHILRVAGPGEGATHAAVRSFNNHWGVPLTLARMPAETAAGVFEIGMNHPGEIGPLSRLVRPDAALITTVEAVHLEAFDSIEGIADAKAEIFEGLAPGGAAILNRDNPHYARLRAAAEAAGAGEIFAFGEGAEAARLIAAELIEVGANGAPVTRVTAALFGEELVFEIGAPGRHFAMNALGALLAARIAGAPLLAGAQALSSWSAVAGRGARERLSLPGGGEILLIDESYNANPASMRAALDAFAAVEPPGTAETSGRRIAFLTDMLELGPTAPALHAALAEAPGMTALDTVHTAGPLMAALHETLAPERRGAHFADAAAMADAAPGLLRAGDAVVVKGSLGSKAQAVAAGLRGVTAS